MINRDALVVITSVKHQSKRELPSFELFDVDCLTQHCVDTVHCWAVPRRTNQALPDDTFKVAGITRPLVRGPPYLYRFVN